MYFSLLQEAAHLLASPTSLEVCRETNRCFLQTCSFQWDNFFRSQYFCQLLLGFTLNSVSYFIMNRFIPKQCWQIKKIYYQNNDLVSATLYVQRPIFGWHIRSAESVFHHIYSSWYCASSETPYSTQRRCYCSCGTEYRKRPEWVHSTSRAIIGSGFAVISRLRFVALPPRSCN